jgi:hypothetical protein
MSSNAVTSAKPFRDPTTCLEMTLQQGMNANDCGHWMYVGGYEKKTIHVVIGGNMTVTLYGSNLPSAPDDANDNGVVLQLANAANAVFAANAMYEHKAPIKWIKAGCVLGTAPGNASVYLQGAP